MRGRGDRDGSRAQSNPAARTRAVDAGEPFGEVVGAERCRIEDDRAAALRGHLGGDPAGDDVARGELGVRVHVEHEPVGRRRSRSTAPSPRTASETRELPGSASAVGWNW